MIEAPFRPAGLGKRTKRAERQGRSSDVMPKKARPCQASATGRSQRPLRTSPTLVMVLSKTMVSSVTLPDAASAAKRCRGTWRISPPSR